MNIFYKTIKKPFIFLPSFLSSRVFSVWLLRDILMHKAVYVHCYFVATQLYAVKAQSDLSAI